MTGKPRRDAQVELHLHLDCSATFGVIKSPLAGHHAGRLPARLHRPGEVHQPRGLLLRPPRIVVLMQDDRGLRLIVEDVFDQLARDGISYAERAT
jgi:adenosine deaminase